MPHDRILQIDPKDSHEYKYTSEDITPAVNLDLIDNLIFTVPDPPRPQVRIVHRIESDSEDDVVEIKK